MHSPLIHNSTGHSVSYILLYKGEILMAMNEARLQRVLAAMEQAGLEQIIVTSRSAVFYLTGVSLDPMERIPKQPGGPDSVWKQAF